MKEFTQDMNVVRNEVNQLSGERERQKSKLEDAEIHIEELKSQNTNLEIQICDLTKHIDQLNYQINSQQSMSQLSEQELQHSLFQHQEQLNSLKYQLEVSNRNLLAQTELTEQLEQQKQHLNNGIENFQQIQQSHLENINDKTEQLENVRIQLNETSQQLIDRENLVGNLRNQIENLENSLKSSEYDKLSSINQLHNMETEVSLLSAKLEDDRRQFQNSDAQSAELQTKITELKLKHQHEIEIILNSKRLLEEQTELNILLKQEREEAKVELEKLSDKLSYNVQFVQQLELKVKFLYSNC